MSKKTKPDTGILGCCANEFCEDHRPGGTDYYLATETKVIPWDACESPHTSGHNFQTIGGGPDALGTWAEPTKAFCTKCGKIIKLETP